MAFPCAGHELHAEEIILPGFKFNRKGVLGFVAVDLVVACGGFHEHVVAWVHVGDLDFIHIDGSVQSATDEPAWPVECHGCRSSFGAGRSGYRSQVHRLFRCG